MKLREYFHFVDYDAHITGTKNDVDCPVVRAGAYIPLEDLDQEIDHWGGTDEWQEIYFAGSDEPDYIISQGLTIEEEGTSEIDPF